MKNIGVALIFLMIAAMSNESMAQRFAVIGGLSMSDMLAKDNYDNYSDEFKMKPGFHVGIMGQFPKSSLLSFETGVFLNSKGIRQKEEYEIMGENYSFRTRINLFYLDVSFTLKISITVGNVIIYGATGPYVGIGLTGKMNTVYEVNGEKETDTDNVKWGTGGDNHLKRLDYGLTFGAGVVLFKALQLGLSYDLGLANISAYTDEGNVIKNRVFRTSVGYRFGCKNKEEVPE